MKYGIIRRPILVKLGRQSNSFFKDLDVNEMVFLFNRAIKNIISNYNPHEIIICDDRNPPWINNRVKELINEKNDTFLCYLHSNKDPNLFNKVEYLQNELKPLIEANKEKYQNKKIPCIPPLFHQNKYITKCKDKAFNIQ